MPAELVEIEVVWRIVVAAVESQHRIGVIQIDRSIAKPLRVVILIDQEKLMDLAVSQVGGKKVVIVVFPQCFA